MTNEYLIGKIFNELEPVRGSMDIWRQMLHCSFLLDDDQRGEFYQRFYSMFNAGEITEADQVADICDDIMIRGGDK
ncbi:MAG: hypothetical protein HUK20_11075 [Fibrobacter sp.]|nr:hypothetical protein [Fibrobacter sp.]